MTETVLVTGGFGLVGSATVRRLAADGRRVVATDLDTPANRKAAAKLPAGVEARWADLTDPDQVQRLVADIDPEAIIHLAAIIAPAIYRIPKVARRINVDATATLVRIAEGATDSPAFRPCVEQCSVRRAQSAPHHPRPLRADDPMRPCDVYSGQKAEAEEIVRSSNLEWVVLRFGGVLSIDLSALPFDADAHVLRERSAERQAGCTVVDVRDVAWACAAATTADVAREILLIAGDESHRMRLRRCRTCARFSTGRSGGGAAGAARQPRQRHRLVRDRLDGHHQGAGSVGVPAPFMARHARRVARGGRMEALPGPAHRTGRPRGDEAPRSVLESTGPVRRSVGRDTHQIGRPGMGSAVVFAGWRISRDVLRSSPAEPMASVSRRQREFARRGARVMLGDIDQSALDDAVANLRADGVDAHGVVCDVRKLDDVEPPGR